MSRDDEGAPQVVGVSGSPTRPSRTSVLVRAVTDAVAASLGGAGRTIELHPLLGELGRGPFREDLGPNARAALDAVESADVLVVGSPAYRATYSGLFKLFFDHVGQYALIDKPVLLTATGGSDRHALLVEHQMRPLFGFFQALTLPVGVYANAAGIADGRIVDTAVQRRIEAVLDRAAPLVRAHLDRLAPAGRTSADLV